MEQVGIRELKDRLAHYLRAVRQGQIVIVTHRGEPVARLVPIGMTSSSGRPPELEDKLWELAAQGLLEWQGGSVELPEPVAINRSEQLLSDLVIQDRE